MQLRNVVIVDGVRSPFARGGRGKLVATRLDDVGATIIRTLMERNPKVKPSIIEDVGLGNVAQSGEFIGLGSVARLAGLPMEVSAFNSNRQCGSSMETMQRWYRASPLAHSTGHRPWHVRMGRTLGGGGGGGQQRTRINQPRRMELNKAQHDMSADHKEHFSVAFPDFILDSPPMVSMLQTAQNVADTYGLSRAELDEFTVRATRSTARLIRRASTRTNHLVGSRRPGLRQRRQLGAGLHGKMVTFDIDEGYRPGTNFEALQNLKPVQGYVSYGDKELVITAGNSCQPTTASRPRS